MFNFNKLLHKNKKEVTEPKATPESFKNLDYLLRTGYNARVMELGEGAAYEIKSDITQTDWFDEVSNEELTITSEDQGDGTYLVTVLINQLETL